MLSVLFAFWSFNMLHWYESGYMELELHVARFFEKIENDVWKFQKIWDKKSWDRQLWDLLVCKESILNSLYFGLSKNDLEVSTSRFFVPNFLKLRSVIFDFFFKKRLHGARAPFEVFLIDMHRWPPLLFSFLLSPSFLVNRKSTINIICLFICRSM
jgi:hypothetical protein